MQNNEYMIGKVFFTNFFFFFNNLDNKDSLGKLSYGMGNEEKNKIL